MKNIIIPFFALAILVLPSCDSDFFENTVEIEIPDHTPTIAVSGTITEGAEEIEFYVSFSQGKNEQSALLPLSDAVVKLYKNGTLLTDLIFDNDEERFIAPLSPGDVVSGSTYKIEVSHPDYATVTSEQVIPNKISINKFEFEAEGTVNDFGEKADEFRLELTDLAGEDNYYSVEIYGTNSFFNGIDTTYYIQDVELMTLDPSIVYGFHPINYNGVPMIGDAVFPGKTYEMIFNSYPSFWEPGTEIGIELKSITRERYLYLLSLKNYEGAEDNPFAEPVTVFGNIENGNGVFGAEAVTKITYKVP